MTNPAVPQPTPAALAALEVSQDRENVESALSVLAGVIRRGEGWSPYCELAIVAASASLAALLAAARRGAGEKDDAFDTGFRRGFLAGYDHAPAPYTITSVCEMSRQATRDYFDPRAAHPEEPQ